MRSPTEHGHSTVISAGRRAGLIGQRASIMAGPYDLMRRLLRSTEPAHCRHNPDLLKVTYGEITWITVLAHRAKFKRKFKKASPWDQRGRLNNLNRKQYSVLRHGSPGDFCKGFVNELAVVGVIPRQSKLRRQLFICNALTAEPFQVRKDRLGKSSHRRATVGSAV